MTDSIQSYVAYLTRENKRLAQQLKEYQESEEENIRIIRELKNDNKRSSTKN